MNSACTSAAAHLEVFQYIVGVFLCNVLPPTLPRMEDVTSSPAHPLPLRKRIGAGSSGSASTGRPSSQDMGTQPHVLAFSATMRGAEYRCAVPRPESPWRPFVTPRGPRSGAPLSAAPTCSMMTSRVWRPRCPTLAVRKAAHFRRQRWACTLMAPQHAFIAAAVAADALRRTSRSHGMLAGRQRTS